MQKSWSIDIWAADIWKEHESIQGQEDSWLEVQISTLAPSAVVVSDRHYF